MISSSLAPADAGSVTVSSVDLRPPGDRYFRHPGDAVRLVLWAVAVGLLAVFIWVATDTADGVSTDLGRLAALVPRSGREFALVLAQVAALAAPVVIVVWLMAQRRWRRTAVVVVAGAVAAAAFRLFEVVLDLPGRLPDAVTTSTWITSARFPSLVYVAGLSAAATVGKPWLGRSWRRATDVALVALGLVVALAGTAGVSGLLLAVATGAVVGAAVLVAVGAPNRRPTPAAVAAALRGAGLDVVGLRLERAEGGRAQLYVADCNDGQRAFVKVCSRDSRDADLLYRGYRTLLLRDTNDDWPSISLEHDVEHEALLLVLARQGGVTCPRVELITRLADGSMALALEHVSGCRLDQIAADAIDDGVLDAIWREVNQLHDRRLAHRALRAANILVDDGRPVIIDLGFAEESATPRMQAVDRAELLASLSALVGRERSIASATRMVAPAQLAAAAPFLQPLALSNGTRKQVSKTLLRDLRADVTTSTGGDQVPLERLVRVRPRTVMMIAAVTAAFYILLPQLAQVGDSVKALRTANWAWLVLAVVASGLTYVTSALGVTGGVSEHIPLVPTVGAQLASSFVNRVTPANVGGMALNVRFLQKAGVDPAEAVTGVGLNVVAGAIVHLVLLVVFFAWAGNSGAAPLKIPSSSKLLVVIAVVLALAGVAAVTRAGRRLVRTHVIDFVKRSWASLVSLARSPLKLAALFGGSLGVTLAYIGALAAAVAAFHGHLTVAQVGAVYLGASVIAAAAPTPGGLGAIEAALVAGFTGLGMEPGIAVASVLSYRLATYWLPILPGSLSLHALERRGLV